MGQDPYGLGLSLKRLTASPRSHPGGVAQTTPGMPCFLNKGWSDAMGWRGPDPLPSGLGLEL